MGIHNPCHQNLLIIAQNDELNVMIADLNMDLSKGQPKHLKAF